MNSASMNNSPRTYSNRIVRVLLKLKYGGNSTDTADPIEPFILLPTKVQVTFY